MNTESILNRIGYSGSLEVTAQVLQSLQKAFLFSVPFENLDIHAGVPITLEPERIYNKIVVNRRGGFCYECNWLFYQLLLQLGFDVQIIAARMTLRDTNSPGYSHMALVVTLDQPYLVDVGNGQSVHVPMAIPGGVSAAERIHYRLSPFNDEEYALYFKKQDSSAWLPRFVFSTEARRLEQFTTMCNYHQTSPESLFTRQRLCTLPTSTGRITLAGRHITIDDNGHETGITVDSTAELEAALRKYFAIEMAIPSL